MEANQEIVEENVKVLQIKESIAVPLSQEEIMKKASLAAAIVEELEKVEAEAKEAAAEYRSVIQTLKNKQAAFLRCVRTGKEFISDAPCDQVFKLGSRVVELWYDGNLISTRAMTPKEAALVTPTVFEIAQEAQAPKPAVLKRQPASQEEAPNPGELPDDMPTDPALTDNEIRDVMREETNKKKKKDLLK